MSDEIVMSGQDKPDPDEMYCSNCGEIISEKAEVCPECGVRQNEASDFDVEQGRKYELRNIARKSTILAIILSIIVPPIGYFYIGENKLGILCLFTIGYFTLGIFIVPVHVYLKINNAQEELEKEGVDWRS